MYTSLTNARSPSMSDALIALISNILPSYLQPRVCICPGPTVPELHEALVSQCRWNNHLTGTCWRVAYCKAVAKVTEYGNAASFWVEYPSGLIDLSRTVHAQEGGNQPPSLRSSQLDIPVNGDRIIRINKATTAAVIIDMQNFFLHPDIRTHTTGLNCITPLRALLSTLRQQGVKILWVNWGLTRHELQTIPPSLIRGFAKSGRGRLGSELPSNFGRLLMRNEYNSELYGPLQEDYLRGKDAGTDVWIHKNRMSGLTGYQNALDLYLQENGMSTLLFGGVNTDQCVGGTLVDAYCRGYDCILVRDVTATTSPAGALENVFYNTMNSYGFLTDTTRIIEATTDSYT